MQNPHSNEALTKMKADMTLTVIDYQSQPGFKFLQVHSHTVLNRNHWLHGSLEDGFWKSKKPLWSVKEELNMQKHWL